MWFKSAELAKHDWRLVLDHVNRLPNFAGQKTRIFALALADSDVHAAIVTARRPAPYR
jgi:hypothetical protein